MPKDRRKEFKNYCARGGHTRADGDDLNLSFLIIWDHLKKNGETGILRRAIELYYGIEVAKPLFTLS